MTVERILISEAEHVALIRASNRGEPVCTSFGTGGVFLLPVDGRWQRWALDILAEMRGLKLRAAQVAEQRDERGKLSS